MLPRDEVRKLLHGIIDILPPADRIIRDGGEQGSIERSIGLNALFRRLDREHPAASAPPLEDAQKLLIEDHDLNAYDAECFPEHL